MAYHINYYYQVLRLRKGCSNDSSANINLSKTQLPSWGRLLEPLLKTGLPLMKHVLKSSAKSVSIPIGLAVSATDAAIHKKMFGSVITTLITSNEEMNDIIKKDKSLEKSGLLTKGVSKTIKNEAKNKKTNFSACY